MTKEQIEEMAASLGTKNAKQVTDLFEAARVEDGKAATALEVKLLNDLGPESAHMKAIQSQLDQIATDQKTARQENMVKKSFNQHIAEICKNDDYLNIKRNGGKFTAEIPIDFESKVAGTMLNSGQSGLVPRPSWIPGVQKAPDQMPFVADLCPVVPVATDIVYYVNRSARTDGAAAQTEGSALGQSDYTYATATQAIADHGTYVKISDNMLQDNDFVAGQLNAEMPWGVMNDLDETVVASAIAGATAYSASGKVYEANVVNANEFDVLRTAINQARTSKFQPDAILVHHDDYTMMELNKSTEGVYAVPAWATNNNLTVSGVRILPSTYMTAGTYLVSTFARTPLAMRQNLILEFGYDADDFTKRLVTARAYVRAAHVFSTSYTAGFITSTFTAAKAALNKV